MYTCNNLRRLWQNSLGCNIKEYNWSLILSSVGQNNRKFKGNVFNTEFHTDTIGHCLDYI